MIRIYNLIGCIITFRNFHKLLINKLFNRWIGSGAPEGILRNGIKLYFDRQAVETSRAITQEIWHRRVYQFPKVCGSFKTIVDIGANIGAFSLFAAYTIPDAKIYCIEPQSNAFSLLTANVDRNLFTQKIITLQRAIASKSDVRDLLQSSISSTRCSFIPNTFLQTENKIFESVKTSSLQDLFCELGIERCDFLKIDCEGAEFEVFDDVDPELLKRISHISMECHPGIAGRDTNSIVEKLKKCGFSVEVTDLDAANGLYLVNAIGAKY